MMVWAVMPNGLRMLQPLPNVAEWCSCFDLVQMNEDEMAMMAPDPMALAATALANGVRSLTVTLGKRGVVYFATPDFDHIDDLRRPRPLGATLGPLRTALVATPNVNENGGDPTGCGDVWGATYFSRLLAGDNLGDAILAAHRAAARNVDHRGATGLANHLRGTISLT
jgi:sugar/nucleoside kinase (ribokinase family)